MATELTDREVRVLGALVEKELTTPDYYPMTLNALLTACNQKTNREPVVSYDTEDVVEAIEALQRKRLVGSASSSSGRTARYRHALVEALELDRRQRAVLASLMLRGPQTPGEIRARSGRMFPFGSLEEVDEVMESLMAQVSPLVTRLPRMAGHKEARYAHLFSGEPDLSESEHQPTGESVGPLEERLARLEQQVEDLATAFAEFRRQFE